MKKAHQAARAQGEGHGGSAREEEVPRAEINPMWEGGSSGLRGAEHRQLGTSHRELLDSFFIGHTSGDCSSKRSGIAILTQVSARGAAPTLPSARSGDYVPRPALARSLPAQVRCLSSPSSSAG